MAYNCEAVIQILASDMGEEGAHEWFEFNTLGAWMGDTTPCFITVQT